MKKRAFGYYWVKHKQLRVWEVAEYRLAGWYFTGEERSYDDKDILIIGERIKR